MTSSTLRFDPRYPLLWRTPSSLQIGVDEPLVVLDEVTETDERLLHALRRGVSPEGLRMIAQRYRATAKQLHTFLGSVAPALDCGYEASLPTLAAAVTREGPGRPAPGDSTTQRLLELLDATGLSGHVVIDAPDAPSLPQTPMQTQTLVILLSTWAVSPARAAHWMNTDSAHLAVVFGDRVVRIGPLVRPGAGPCLHCVERWHIDHDPAWPAMAGQLLGRPAPTTDPLTSATVSALVVRLCSQFVSQTIAAGSERSRRPGQQLAGPRPGLVLHLDSVTGVVTESEAEVHPECACQALPESAMVVALGSDWHPSGPTTTPEVGARASPPRRAVVALHRPDRE
ncbi:bacteriocin biosynthesis cyclodehydratase domain-containing protein [Subtercola frigoramans]|uniref:Bacteriocin biosynthesis cyclodehydratase domain-containing protein n=1 Tax=Subtercola frigoramans TaxID=120298 RepID=A0ABS2L427_9MICO|nr:bacteriocin biosynthesis cyclodehydratase domain-containing protein [Subtercola frigoramans]